jgi:hypothetical protein
MLSGRKKKDYAAESSADLLEAAAAPSGEADSEDVVADDDAEQPSVPADEPIPEAIAA